MIAYLRGELLPALFQVAQHVRVPRLVNLPEHSRPKHHRHAQRDAHNLHEHRHAQEQRVKALPQTPQPRSRLVTHAGSF